MVQQEKFYMNKFIDPKNPHTVGKSMLNLGNHVLILGFIMALVFVVWVSYKQDNELKEKLWLNNKETLI